jgi:hypothetical protein
MSFAITGPQLPAGVLYRQARQRALHQLETRANQTTGACHFCASGLYDVPVEGCPSCGGEAYAPPNGLALEQRSASTTAT